MTIASTAWLLTVGWVSNPRPLAEPSCLGTGTIPEVAGDSVYASVANAVVGEWSTPTTGTTLSGEILQSTRLFQWNVGEKNSVTHLVGLSELESISIDDEVGARDKWRREDNFPLKDPAISRMRLASDGLLLDMMIVRRESRSHGLYEFALPTINSSVQVPYSRCGEGSVDVCQARALFVVMLSLKTSYSPSHSRASTPTSHRCYIISSSALTHGNIKALGLRAIWLRDAIRGGERGDQSHRR